MKAVILAGGRGTRLAEETHAKPKPLVEVGGHPILWHIMKHFSQYGVNEFYIALGYRGNDIKRYFLDKFRLNGNMTVDFSEEQVVRHGAIPEDWKIHLIETGIDTNTGGRINRLKDHLKEDDRFFVTYGDGVSSVDLDALQESHKGKNNIVTLTAVRPPSRFGGITFNETGITFSEKTQIGDGWINGGFMIAESAIFDFIEGDDTSFEYHTLEQLADEEKLGAYQHPGFWQCMDTIRDRELLERLWQAGDAPWKTWN